VPDQAADELWPPLSGPAGGHDGPRRPGTRGVREQPQRGRGRNRNGPPLSRAEIVDAAIAIADAEGAEAVSMRRIAQVLRAGTMSLYWHVTNKEQLIDLMLDALMGEGEALEPTGDWRADLRELARSQRAMMQRHLWVMNFIGGRPALGPNTLLNMEQGLAVLDQAGLDIASSLPVLETVLTYVLGAVLRETRETRIDRSLEQAGLTLEEWTPMRGAWRDRLAADGRFGHVVRFLDQHIDPDAEETRDERFEFGLDCVIEGISSVLSKRKPGGATS
jgi:AcrR family transcriptional regulator